MTREEPEDVVLVGRWSAEVRPRLATKVRMRWDDARGKPILLYPEGVLLLNPTAHAVLELCDGTHTLGDVVRELAGRFDGPGGGTRNSSTVPGPAPTGPGVVEAASAETIETDSADPRIQAAAEETARATEPRAVARDPGESAEARERQVARDVVAFLERIDERGWLVVE